jgi:hypothetical protein
LSPACILQVDRCSSPLILADPSHRSPAEAHPATSSSFDIHPSSPSPTTSLYRKDRNSGVLLARVEKHFFIPQRLRPWLSLTALPWRHLSAVIVLESLCVIGKPEQQFLALRPVKLAWSPPKKLGKYCSYFAMNLFQVSALIPTNAVLH